MGNAPAAKAGLGVADVPVVVGNAIVASGEWVFSDVNGVLVPSAEESHANAPA